MEEKIGVTAGVPQKEDSKPTEKPVEQVEDVPDPDEDDLDDLDDMLDDFSAAKQDAKKPVSQPAGPGRPTDEAAASGAKSSSASAAAGPTAAAAESVPSLDDILSDEEFTKQLQAGMADLIGELENSPDMQGQFEDIFKQMSGAAAAAGQGSPSTTSTGPEAGASFQETIRRTMERVQASGDQATTAAAASADASDDFLAEMMKQMAAGGLDGAGSEEDFSKMLMGMMEQLTNKEILYEPMKELNDKFPEWMEKNRDKTAAEDLKRYEEQQALVKEIVAKFEEKTYADSNAADREYIVDRMQKMQAAGSPPSDLVGDMASAQEAFNAPSDEACNPQ